MKGTLSYRVRLMRKPANSGYSLETIWKTPKGRDMRAIDIEERIRNLGARELDKEGLEELGRRVDFVRDVSERGLKNPLSILGEVHEAVSIEGKQVEVVLVDLAKLGELVVGGLTGRLSEQSLGASARGGACLLTRKDTIKVLAHLRDLNIGVSLVKSADHELRGVIIELIGNSDFWMKNDKIRLDDGIEAYFEATGQNANTVAYKLSLIEFGFLSSEARLVLVRPKQA